ncbi:MAG: hypothetical protein LBH53_01400 [Puniceicoccales bacterium]|jgi:hypothetical protein|nr:hypothetical protein [Puniceicoccales bacterium]
MSTRASSYRHDQSILLAACGDIYSRKYGDVKQQGSLQEIVGLPIPLEDRYSGIGVSSFSETFPCVRVDCLADRSALIPTSVAGWMFQVLTVYRSPWVDFTRIDFTDTVNVMYAETLILFWLIIHHSELEFGVLPFLADDGTEAEIPMPVATDGSAISGLGAAILLSCKFLEERCHPSRDLGPFYELHWSKGRPRRGLRFPFVTPLRPRDAFDRWAPAAEFVAQLRTFNEVAMVVPRKLNPLAVRPTLPLLYLHRLSRSSSFDNLGDARRKEEHSHFLFARRREFHGMPREAFVKGHDLSTLAYPEDLPAVPAGRITVVMDGNFLSCITSKPNRDQSSGIQLVRVVRTTHDDSDSLYEVPVDSANWPDGIFRLPSLSWHFGEFFANPIIGPLDVATREDFQLEE